MKFLVVKLSDPNTVWQHAEGKGGLEGTVVGAYPESDAHVARAIRNKILKVVDTIEQEYIPTEEQLMIYIEAAPVVVVASADEEAGKTTASVAVLEELLKSEQAKVANLTGQLDVLVKEQEAKVVEFNELKQTTEQAKQEVATLMQDKADLTEHVAKLTNDLASLTKEDKPDKVDKVDKPAKPDGAGKAPPPPPPPTPPQSR